MSVLIFALGVALGILLEAFARALDERAGPLPEASGPEPVAPPRMARCDWGVVMIDGHPTLRYLMAPESEWPREMLN